jgi:NAD(P)H dehydrogenase (quinone)
MSQTIKHAVIVCHPAEDSFTMSLANRYVETVRGQGHEAVVRDLYRLRFDPVLRDEERRGAPAEDVAREWAALGKPDVYVLVYPIWFGTPPAMLKGYIDRVFGAGRTLGMGGDSVSAGLLSGAHLVSLTSSGSMRAWLSEKGVLGSLRTVFDRYLSEVFGFADTARYHFDGVGPEMEEKDVRFHLAEAEKAAKEVMARVTETWMPYKPVR